MKRMIPILCLFALSAVTLASAGNIVGGTTTVTFSQTFLDVLTNNSLTPTAIAPGALVGGQATFPITGGNIDSTGNALITHSGGLNLAGGGNFLSIGDFVIDTSLLQVSGYALNNSGLNAASVPLFDIGSGLELFLTSTAAGAVSATFFGGDPNITTALTGLDVGTASPNPQVVPEPGSLALLGSGIVGLAGFLRRRGTR